MTGQERTAGRSTERGQATGDYATDKVAALRKILELEASRDYADRTVAGGLDRFLQNWGAELQRGLGIDLAPDRPYAELSREARRAWAEAILRPRVAMALNPPIQQPPAPRRDRRRARSVAAQRKAGRPQIAPSLATPILDLRLVTPATADRLRSLGVVTLRDLLFMFPSRHIDYSTVLKINQLRPGYDATILATVWEASEKKIGPPPGAAQAVVSDGTGTVSVTWFRQSYLAKRLQPGTRLAISGKVQTFRGRLQFQNPEYEVLVERGEDDKGAGGRSHERDDGLAGEPGERDDRVHAGNLLPVYPSTEGLQQRSLRTAAKNGLDAGLGLIDDHLPPAVLERQGLTGLRDAISGMHLPASAEQREAARRRLAFDELFINQVGVQRRRIEWRKRGEGIPVRVDRAVVSAFLDTLPYELTGGQRKALDDILSEMAGDVPMSRLLQGEVGSGKTVVAIAALLAASSSGLQGALMAPTEVLAEQHFLNVCAILGARAVFGRPDAVRECPAPRLSIGLLIGSLPPRTKSDVRRLISAGAIDICVGTHALIQEAVEVPRLAMAVVDEQHRFGVEQRAALKQKGLKPHLLAMSATPIPRSLALTLYGDLDLSTLRELPGGRRPIETRWVIDDSGRRDAYALIRREVASGRQAFVVCPLIERSEEVKGRSAIDEQQRLSTQIFPDLRVGLLHGRMPLAEKQAAMERFRANDIQVLVATPVIEVGIDIANATVMMIESADRFGLSQLHQLRGRVGRGEHKSYCLLLADEPTGDAQERLATVARTSDGFELAEADLTIRGPGDFLGTRQSGFAELKVATLADIDLLEAARAEAATLLKDDPDLAAADHRPLAREVAAVTRRPAEIS